LVLDSAGNLYGTTFFGGDYLCAQLGCGIVFRVDPTGGEIVLHRFGFALSPDAGFPRGELLRDAAGTLYGATYGGGKYSNGAVFALHPNGKETLLHDFYPGEGRNPMGALTRDAAGSFYGTTEQGGAYGNGTVFELPPV
jgi:uncharacterized repeat protein (TIGR03803 family)